MCIGKPLFLQSKQVSFKKMFLFCCQYKLSISLPLKGPHHPRRRVWRTSTTRQKRMATAAIATSMWSSAPPACSTTSPAWYNYRTRNKLVMKKKLIFIYFWRLSSKKYVIWHYFKGFYSPFRRFFGYFWRRFIIDTNTVRFDASEQTIAAQRV